MINLTTPFADTPCARFIENPHSLLIAREHGLNIKLVHLMLGYPHQYQQLWSPKSDIFGALGNHNLELVRNKKAYLVLDGSYEGYSPTKQVPYLEAFYHNCRVHRVSPCQVIFMTANAHDTELFAEYAKKHQVKPMHVLFFPFFQVQTTDFYRNKYRRHVLLKNRLLDRAEHYTKKLYQGKMVLSLSRRLKLYRTMANFMLSQTELGQHAIISQARYNEFPVTETEMLLAEGYNIRAIGDWFNSLPLIADYTDFENNWARGEYDYHTIHYKTLFHIVNETDVNDYSNTAFFYSEKTFRPTLVFQPFMIYGQPGANRRLEEMGYRLYTDWFDLSFDSEPHPVKRYKKLLSESTRVFNELKGLSRDQQIEWKFKCREVLQHNFDCTWNHAYSNKCIQEFAQRLKRV